MYEVSRTRYGTSRPVSNGFCTTTEIFSTISIPLTIAGSRPRAGWLPALTKSYSNLSFLPVASWNPGKKTTVIWSSCGMTNKLTLKCPARHRHPNATDHGQIFQQRLKQQSFAFLNFDKLSSPVTLQEADLYGSRVMAHTGRL